MKKRAGGSETTAAALIVLGVVIGAGIIYGTLSYTGGTLVRTSTSYVTYTTVVTVTTTLTSAYVGTAQVQVVNLAISHSTASGSFAASCAISAGGGSFIQFENAGTANTMITALSLTYGGTTYSTTPAGTCIVPAGASLYLQISAIGPSPSAGQQFSGFAVTSNGAQVVFAGAFN